MREAVIGQAYELEHPIEIASGELKEGDGIRSTRISENNGANPEITELTEEVHRLAERAKHLLGPDFNLDEEAIFPDALAELARAEAQADWKTSQRFDAPRYHTTSVDRETQNVRNIHEVLRQKEHEVAVLQDEIEALRKVVPLLSECEDKTWNSERGASRPRQPVCIP